MRSKIAWVIFGCVAGLGGLVAGVSAQTCTADSACPRGFRCEVTAVSGCTTPAARPAMRPACDGGSECFAPADSPAPPPSQPPCTPQEYRSCVPGKCASDGDCASGMVCHERSTGTCTATPAAACAPGAKCAPLPMPVCTDSVEHVCVPRYVLPCEQASDCGAGFTCEAQQTCGCSGSAGTPAPPAGPTPPDAGTQSFAPALPLPPPDCKCEPTRERYCKVIETACRADSDCSSEFVCQQTAPATPMRDIACDPASGKGDAGVCGADRGIAAPPPGAYRCIPRFEYIDADHGAPRGGDAAIPTSTPVPQTAERPTKDPSIPPPTTPGMAADAGVATPAAGATPPHVRACSVSSLGAHRGGGAGELSLWAVLGMLGLAAFVRRRTAG